MGHMSTQPVKIAWGSPYKAPTVLLGDQLITDASRVTVDCSTGGPPKVFLEFEGKEVEDLQFEGVVHIVRETPADPFEGMLLFLSEIDPSALEKATLEVQAMGGPQGFGEAAVQVLKEWAGGKS
jgi:hypothetical protein